MARQIVVSIATSGETKTLHNDDFTLRMLGDMHVERVSNIVFDEATQRWDVVLVGQEEPFDSCRGFESYSEGVAFEVAWLQACVCAYEYGEVTPTSGEGEALSYVLRRDWEKRNG